jgi:hypothetical protein
MNAALQILHTLGSLAKALEQLRAAHATAVDSCSCAACSMSRTQKAQAN